MYAMLCRHFLLPMNLLFIQNLTEDVSRQTEREKELQARYDKLNFDLQNLQVEYAKGGVGDPPPAEKVDVEGDQAKQAQ